MPRHIKQNHLKSKEPCGDEEKGAGEKAPILAMSRRKARGGNGVCNLYKSRWKMQEERPLLSATAGRGAGGHALRKSKRGPLEG